ncbi:MAG: AAA family ATPase [Acidaminococcaceae bacterium]|nr:AAA family ATPase [Acidaminococcaceae bacterium]
MYIKSLHLMNFRCYNDFAIDFDKRMTVLVGLNGRGKTAILDAVELAMSGFDENPLPIGDKDIRKVPVRENKKIVRMVQDVPLEIEADFGKNMIYRSKARAGVRSETTITGIFPKEKVTNIFAYYGTDRMNYIVKMVKLPLSAFKGKFPVVKKAVDTLMKDYHITVDYNEKLKQFVVFDPVEGEQLISGASDGARSVMGMVADIAMQMALANPDMGPEVIRLTPGIVIIDEIELHLHPGWHQRVLWVYQKLFPKIQFIVTTHSPQVLSTVMPKCIRILADDTNMVYIPEFSLGAESGQILRDIQHVENRAENLPIVKCLNKYLDLVAQDKFDTPEALKLRKKLDAWSGGQDPILTKVDMDIRLRQLRRKR